MGRSGPRRSGVIVMSFLGPRVRGGRRAWWPVWVAAGASAWLVLSLTGVGSLVVPAGVLAAHGAVTLVEQSGGVVCTSASGSVATLDASTCGGINKLGGDLEMPPGKTVTTPVVISNLGTTDAHVLELVPVGSCSQTLSGGLVVASPAKDLCSRIWLTVTSGGRTVFSGTAAALGRATESQLSMPAAPRAGESIRFVFRATIEASVGNAYMGLGAGLPMRWTMAR